MLPFLDELVHAPVEPLEAFGRESLGLGGCGRQALRKARRRAKRNEHRAYERQAQDESTKLILNHMAMHSHPQPGARQPRPEHQAAKRRAIIMR